MWKISYQTTIFKKQLKFGSLYHWYLSEFSSCYKFMWVALYSWLLNYVKSFLLPLAHTHLKIKSFAFSYFMKYVINLYFNSSMLYLRCFVSFLTVASKLVQNPNFLEFFIEIFITPWIYGLMNVQNWTKMFYKIHIFICYMYRSFRAYYFTWWWQLLFALLTNNCV